MKYCIRPDGNVISNVTKFLRDTEGRPILCEINDRYYDYLSDELTRRNPTSVNFRTPGKVIVKCQDGVTWLMLDENENVKEMFHNVKEYTWSPDKPRENIEEYPIFSSDKGTYWHTVAHFADDAFNYDSGPIKRMKFAGYIPGEDPSFYSGRQMNWSNECTEDGSKAFIATNYYYNGIWVGECLVSLLEEDFMSLWYHVIDAPRDTALMYGPFKMDPERYDRFSTKDGRTVFNPIWIKEGIGQFDGHFFAQAVPVDYPISKPIYHYKGDYYVVWNLTDITKDEFDVWYDRRTGRVPDPKESLFKRGQLFGLVDAKDGSTLVPMEYFAYYAVKYEDGTEDICFIKEEGSKFKGYIYDFATKTLKPQKYNYPPESVLGFLFNPAPNPYSVEDIEWKLNAKWRKR